MQLDPNNLLEELEEHMMKSEESLVTNFHSIRTGKASPSLVEGIMSKEQAAEVQLTGTRRVRRQHLALTSFQRSRRRKY